MASFKYATVEHKLTGESWELQDDRIQGDLDVMGDEGWELVSTAPLNDDSGKTVSLIFSFKLEIEE